MANSPDKQTLKALRASRKVYIDRARKTIKDNNKIIKAIRGQIAARPQTVPEIASALGIDTPKVLLFVSALKKYGEVAEDAKDGDYYKYGLIP
jgi:DNA-directed RNA polymerase specialized sigma subunit